MVIDEIKRRSELFPFLRVLADRKPLPARFLILGNASPDLLSHSSETLAGRLETLHLEGFRLGDLGLRAQGRHWLRGGFPLAYTAKTEADSVAWRRQFLQTFFERDIPSSASRFRPLRSAMEYASPLSPQTWNGAELRPHHRRQRTNSAPLP